MPDRSVPGSTRQFTSQLLQGYQRCLSLVSGNFSVAQSSGIRLTLAVSGGADSVALLFGTLALMRSSRDDRLSADRVQVLHVNHGLRGLQSDDDAEFVRELCESLNVDCQICPADVQALRGAVGSESLEEAARRIRYEALQSRIQDDPSECLVTAHHQDDQAETILHNLGRGSGLRGLQGMTPVRRLQNGVPLIRPMLMISRKTLKEFLQNEGISFREDSSNEDPGFTRNRIRHIVLPSLEKEVHSQASRNIAAAAQQVSEALDCLDQLAGRILADVVLEQTSDSCRLHRERLTDWPEYLVRHIFSVLWIRQHWPRQQMQALHWKKLADCAVDGVPASCSFPGGIQLTIRGQLIHLLKNPKILG